MQTNIPFKAENGTLCLEVSYKIVSRDGAEFSDSNAFQENVNGDRTADEAAAILVQSAQWLADRLRAENEGAYISVFDAAGNTF